MNIMCEICKNFVKQISNKHLKEHNIDKQQYKKLYPNSKLKVTWNNNLTKETDERVKKNSKNVKLNHWSKTKKRKEICAKLSKAKIGKKLSKETKEKLSKLWSNDLNPNYNGKITSQDNIKKILSKKATKRWKNINFKEKCNNSHWSKNIEKSLLTSAKISESKFNLMKSGKLKINTGYKCGWYKSKKMNDKLYYMSSYELERFKFLDKNESIKSFTNKHNIKLKYIDKNGRTRHYLPDLLVKYLDGKIFLEEIKGWINNEDTFKMKNSLAEEYCKKNNIYFRVLFKKDLHLI